MNVHARSVVSDSLWPHELYVACQFPLFNGFSRQEYWSGLPFLLQGIFLTQGLTPWTVACQAPLSMEFSRQEYYSGLPCPSPGDLPGSGTDPGSPALQANSLLSEPQKSLWLLCRKICFKAEKYKSKISKVKKHMTLSQQGRTKWRTWKF